MKRKQVFLPEVIWGTAGFFLLFFPIQFSYVSYYQVQYQWMIFSTCYLVIWTALIVRRKYMARQVWKGTWGWLDCVLLWLMVYLLVRTCWNVEYSGAFWLQLGNVGLAYYCFRNIPHKYFCYLGGALVMGGFLQLGYSLYYQADDFNFAEKWCRIYGCFMNPSVWGNYVALLAVVSMGMIFQERNQRRVIVVISCFLLFLFLLWQSDSRTGWLAALSGCGYIGYRMVGEQWRKAVHGRAVKILFLFIFVCVSVAFYGYKKDSSDGRLLIWRVSADMVKEAPCWGMGVNGFQKNYMMFQAAYLEQHPDCNWCGLAGDSIFAFNEYLRWLVEHGIFVTFLLGIISAYVFRNKMYICKKESTTPSKAVLLAWGILALFSYPCVLWQFVIVLLWAVAGLGGGDAFPLKISRKGWKPILIVWTLVLAVGLVKGGMPSRLCNKAWNLYAEKHYMDAKAAFEKLLDFRTDYYTVFTLGKICRELHENTQAEYYLNLASRMIPNRVLPHYELFLLYRDNISDKDKACKKACLIKRMRIKVYAPPLNIIYKEIDTFEKREDKF